MNLTEAFGLPNHSIVSVVGGGGKTSLIFSLAREAVELGRRGAVTTTTRFTRPSASDDFQVVETGDNTAIEDVRRADRARPLILISGHADKGRLLGFSTAAIDGLAALEFGVIGVEADGSRGRHFKAPGEGEPIIPSSSTDVVVAMGLDVLGMPLSEMYVHRPERVIAIAGGQMGEPITASLAAIVLAHEEGGRKNVPPGARVHALLGSRGSRVEMEAGQNLAARLVYAGFATAVIADAAKGEVYGVVR